jgi:hypothetical protein
LILLGAGCALVLVVAVIAAIQFAKGRAKELAPMANAPDAVQRPVIAGTSPAHEPAPQKEANRTLKPSMPEPQLPAWKPDSLMLAKLASELDVDNYRVQPPKGYFPVQPVGFVPPPEARAFFWASENRENGTAGSFMIMLMALPPGEELPSLEYAHEQMMEGIKRRRESWQAFRAEDGILGGIHFRRSRWSGLDANLGPMHGFSYTAFDGRTLIQISSQDVDDYQEEALKIAEAAVLTFRRR